MNLLFTVCGRGGSKGLKNKNIKIFLGLPLFEYTLAVIDLYKQKNVIKFGRIDTAISTDSSEFKELLFRKEEQNFYLINREDLLAGDSVPKTHVISDALLRTEIKNNCKYDIVVDLDITSPIRTLNDLEKAINKKIAKTDCDVVFSVTHARRNPYFNMVCEREGKIEKVLQSDYTTRQQAPQMYDMNASIYAYAREFLLSGAQSPITSCCDIIEMLDTGIIDIDNENDFQLMEVIYKWLISTNNEYSVIYEIAHEYSKD